MAELATLARPYAGAVFDLAKANGALDRWSRTLGVLAAAAAEPRVKLLLDDPERDEAQKARQLAELCGDEVDDRAKKFLQVLAANRRLGLLEDVREQFEELRARELATLDVEVQSAFPLSEEQSRKLAAALERRFEKSVKLTNSVDAALIGGAVIRAGDTVIDGSLRGRLERLGETLGRS